MKNFSKTQMEKARKTDLYDFLMKNHSDQFKKESDSLRPLNNHSISIKRGYSGYKDFASNASGNSVDYLVREMGYSLVEAVLELCGEESPSAADNTPPDAPQIQVASIFPAPVSGPYRALFAYLTKTRGIPVSTVQALVDRKLIYQEQGHNNIVFINKEQNWAEIRGTLTQKPYHGVLSDSRPDGFWCFRGSKSVNHIYVCESAIDAVSLYLLHRSQGRKEEAYYAGIGGVGKQPAIDRIKRKLKTILAVDNDKAGEECRKRNSELESILPVQKDWNEDWLKQEKG